MTEERLKELVKKRANDRVQKKIATFKSGLRSLFVNLTGDGYISKNPEKNTAREANTYLLASMLQRGSIDFSDAWPNYLWRCEEEAVMKELLDTMDEMQKALVAASKSPNPDDCTSD